MNRVKGLLPLLYAAAAGILTFASCDKHNADTTDEEDEAYFEIIPEGTYEYTVDEWADKVFGPDGANSDNDLAELREAFLENARNTEAELDKETGANGLALSIISYGFLYRSKDADGHTRTLSARVGWGRYWLLGWHNLDPDHIYLYEHPTYTASSECPSEDGSLELGLITNDNLIVMPDGLGYSASGQCTVAYMDRETAARNAIDALEPAMAIFRKYGSGTLEDDWTLRVLGSSDGAANALAIHRYLDTHEDLAGKWRFEYSYCCAGPYDPALTARLWLQKKRVPFPVSVPLLIKSMMARYPDILETYDEEEFYSDKYLAQKASIDEALRLKRTVAEDMNDRIDDALGALAPGLDDFLSADAQNPESDLYKDFLTCLEKNDLTRGWTPKHKIRLYYSPFDYVVPPENTDEVKNAFGDMVEITRNNESVHSKVRYQWFYTLTRAL